MTTEKYTRTASGLRWIAADATDLAAINVIDAERGCFAWQVDNNTLWVAYKSGSGAGIWQQVAAELELLKFSQTAAAVNEITIANAATGYGPEIQATGGDTNVNIEFKPKGTGYVDFQGGCLFETQSVKPAADSGAGSCIEVGSRQVSVQAVTTDANDWIVLPAIASCPIGHMIIIVNTAGSNFELRTPASSGTTINGVDADGTQEYLMTDTQVVRVIKVSATGWMAHDWTAIGALVAAHVPD